MAVGYVGILVKQVAKSEQRVRSGGEVLEM